jgi:methyltransferase (TIGR00027 family)
MTVQTSTQTHGTLITDVTDTARWVAAHRAQESERADALFHDPFAARLSGEVGRNIASLVQQRNRNSWTVVVRTRLIDDIVLDGVKQGFDCVLNLAAGLDTRPYRLALPPSLHWIETDLPALVSHKDQALAGETASCRLTRVAVDLSDSAARSAFFAEHMRSAKRALVITEGLLCYLTNNAVSDLTRELLQLAAVQRWALDVISPAVKNKLHKSLDKNLASAPMHFAPAEGVAFFEKLGWKVERVESLFRAAVGFGRIPLPLRLLAYLPDANPRKIGQRQPWAGVVQLHR